MTPAEFTPEDALVAIMVAVSASDETIRTSELLTIQRIVDHLPLFSEYDEARITRTSRTVFEMFEDEDGLDQLWIAVRASLPERLHETAYAMACDVAASDGYARDGELRMLEEMRYELSITPLSAAAIEYAARARHMTI